jgi:hypothetical protein
VDAGKQVFQSILVIGVNGEQRVISFQATSSKRGRLDFGGEAVAERVADKT